MFRGVLKCVTSKNVLFNGKCSRVSISLKLQPIKNQKLKLSSLSQINYTQKRFCSSNSNGNIIHKVFFVNAESPTPADETFSISESIEYIPPPPIPPDVTEESLHVLNKLGEPTFESLGLGGWTPIGFIQNGLEYLHVTVDLPWWGSIAVATLIMRTLLFPLVIIAQRNAAKMNNVMPAVQALQMRMTEARNSGNQIEAARLGYELQQYMLKKGVNPLKNMIVPIAQAPIFISMFIGLRRCANLPVESMKEGGMMWFTDLTISDPIFVLPIITSLTMLATIEVGTDGQQANSQAGKFTKYILRALPVIIFPFTIQFPAAVLCYWVSSNFFSLLQVGFLRIPKVRAYFKIDPKIQHDPKSLPSNKKGLVGGVKESWSNMKISAQIEERRRFDDVQFKKAGLGTVVKTYKHNPLKSPVIKAKPRD